LSARQQTLKLDYGQSPGWATRPRCTGLLCMELRFSSRFFSRVQPKSIDVSASWNSLG
jgi:hypothetical protein